MGPRPHRVGSLLASEDSRRNSGVHFRGVCLKPMIGPQTLPRSGGRPETLPSFGWRQASHRFRAPLPASRHPCAGRVSFIRRFVSPTTDFGKST